MTQGYSSIHRLTMMNMLNNMAASNVSVKYKLKGPTLSPSTACATGCSSIAEAVNCIRLGFCEAVVAGGTEESINPVIIEACVK